MLEAFRLIPALQFIFTHEIEFTEDSFTSLTTEQLEALRRRGEELPETVYRVLPIEPQAIERSAGKVTMELPIVTEAERQLLLDGVAFVYRASDPLDERKPTFSERLEFLRPRLPSIVTTKPDQPS